MTEQAKRSCPPSIEPLTGNYFVAAYPPFSCWSTEPVEAARRVLGRPADPAAPLGAYVHIPFCDERCDFCYYLSYDDRGGQIDGYLDGVIAEAALYSEQPAIAGRPLEFLYFGGGTPSLLSQPRLERLLDGLADAFDWNRAAEVTFEAAPRSVTRSKLELLRGRGVTRLSLGVQQLDDGILRRNGRIHLVADVERAYREVRSVGFDVVNLDLIAGLVGETDETFFSSLERVIALEPDSVTIYLLEIPRNTPLHRRLEAGGDEPVPDWDTKRARLARAFERLGEAGYAQLTAYAAVRDPARHRFVYMSEQYSGADLIGLGVSSFSYVGGVHYQNTPSLRTHREAVSAGELPIAREYFLSAEERLVRELVLQLKLGGVDLDALRQRHGRDPLAGRAEIVAELCDRGLLESDGGELRVTSRGLVQVDRLIEELYLPGHRGLSYW